MPPLSATPSSPLPWFCTGQAFYSTPQLYTEAKHASGVEFSVKKDDFFPYADCPVRTSPPKKRLVLSTERTYKHIRTHKHTYAHPQTHTGRYAHTQAGRQAGRHTHAQRDAHTTRRVLSHNEVGGKKRRGCWSRTTRLVYRCHHKPSAAPSSTYGVSHFLPILL